MVIAMKKLNTFNLLILIAIIFSALNAKADLKDTVWIKKIDQEGLERIQLIHNDQIIAAAGFSHTVFCDANTGVEIKRLAGKYDFIMLANESKILKLNDERTKFFIYDYESLNIIDSLESDGSIVGLYYSATKDERFFVALINGGIRLWDLQTKRIKITKYYAEEEFLSNHDINNLDISCDDRTVSLYHGKLYKPDLNKESTWYSKQYNTSYLIENLDSLYSIDKRIYRIYFSNTCKYFVEKGPGASDSIKIYNVQTNEVHRTLPIKSNFLSTVEFTSDDKYIVTADRSGQNKTNIWEIESGKHIYKYESHSPTSIQITKDNKYFYSTATGSKQIGKWHLKLPITNIQIEQPGNIIYPNPTNGNINIQFNVAIPSSFQLEITNSLGQILFQQLIGHKEIGINTYNINVAFLPLGNYNLRVYSPSQTFNFSIIKGE